MSSFLRLTETVNQTTLKQIPLLTAKEHKSLSTYQKSTTDSSHLAENHLLAFSLHPAAKCIGTPNLKPHEYKKFVHLLYYGLTYSTKNLKGPTDDYLRKKSVTLP